MEMSIAGNHCCSVDVNSDVNVPKNLFHRWLEEIKIIKWVKHEVKD